MDLSELGLATFETQEDCRDYLVGIWENQKSTRPNETKTFVEWLGQQKIKGQYEVNTDIEIQNRGKEFLRKKNNFNKNPQVTYLPMISLQWVSPNRETHSHQVLALVFAQPLTKDNCWKIGPFGLTCATSTDRS